MQRITVVAAAMLTLGLAACQQDAPPTTTESGAKTVASVAALPANLITETPIADAKPLSEVRAAAKAGETTSLLAYIGGRAEPFTEGRAVFVVADVEKAPACTDGCSTPWDACCVPAEDITANSASIQVVDDKGQPLKVGLEGHGNLKPGSVIEVTGKVREASAVFVVDATSIHVRPATP